jgi:YYY domain-containing protein
MINDVVLHWLVTMLCVTVGIPWTKYLFQTLPHALVGVARPLGYALIGVVVWGLAMIGLLPFNSGSVVFVAIGMGYLGWRLAGGVDRAWLRTHWRAWLLSEIIFLAGFAMVVFVRGRTPDPWGTERPMDYAFFNSMLHSPSFPPLDPWMSGLTINYYYAGYLLAAIPATLTGVDPVVAYNLALATTAGMIGATAATVVVSMAAVWQPVAQPLRKRTAGLFAGLAFCAVLLVGNLGGFLQLVTGLPEVLALEPVDVLPTIQNGLGAREPYTLQRPFQGWDFGGTTQLTPRDTWQDFNWWNPSRAVWDTLVEDNGAWERRYSITEFPFFSFWLGDMHPHVMALPFGLLLLGLALRRAVGTMPNVIIPAVLLGLLYPMNSWDYPTYLVLYLGAMVWQSMRAKASWRAVGIEAGITVLGSYALYLPFHMSFVSLVGGAEPTVTTPILATFSRYFGLAPARTEAHGLFIMFGLFLVPILMAAVSFARDRLEWVLIGVTAIVAIVAGVGGFVTLAAVPLAALLLHYAFRRADVTPAFAIWFGMVALAAVLTLVVDIVYIRDTFSSRMNTVFKFYYQVWALWGVAAVLGVWQIWSTAHTRWRVAGLVLVVPLLGAALSYPAATLGKALLEPRDGTLYGKTPRDYAAGGPASITWLRDHVTAGSVVLEGVGSSYDIEGNGFGGVSASTGFPTVMGWPGHEYQWRGGQLGMDQQISQRENDVRTIYSSTNDAEVRSLLDLYHVRYIYIGNAERTAYGSDAGMMVASLGKQVFADGDIVIYTYNK